MFRSFFSLLLGISVLSASLYGSVQQNLTYGPIPTFASQQSAQIKSITIDLSALKATTSNTLSVKLPYNLMNASSAQAQYILVKIEKKLPANCKILTNLEERAGLTCVPKLQTDAIDRRVVLNMERGSYQGVLHITLDGEWVSALPGSIPMIFTVNSG